MDTSIIISAAKDIETCKKAIAWLRQYGAKLGDKDAASVNIKLHFAGSCSGAQEAAEVLEAYSTLELSRINEVAIRSCENTIEICRSKIERELAGGPRDA